MPRDPHRHGVSQVSSFETYMGHPNLPQNRLWITWWVLVGNVYLVADMYWEIRSQDVWSLFSSQIVMASGKKCEHISRETLLVMEPFKVQVISGRCYAENMNASANTVKLISNCQTSDTVLGLGYAIPRFHFP